MKPTADSRGTCRAASLWALLLLVACPGAERLDSGPADHHIIADVGLGDGGGLDAGPGLDRAGAADVGDAGVAHDVVAADQGSGSDCATAEPFDYSCSAGDPDTCPGGSCLLDMCIAPELDPERWASCGDRSCLACESAQSCPADCADPPATSGTKVHNAPTTLTVWAHGFYNKTPDEVASMVYGADRGCAGLLDEFASYGITRPCSDSPGGDTAADQLTAVEYYGAVPASWLSSADIDEIEQFPHDGAESLERYARILAKFIRHKLSVSGASHVNLACHSMGCLISRHMIEHNLEGLAGENRFVRWFTSAGVLAGARLARLYDNPTVRDGASALGMELNDFVIMHPDFVADGTAVWDHRLHEANNPLFAGMLIHHAGATDPHIQEAMGVTLLDLNNPADLPNDGIMYTDDEFFHRQDPTWAFRTPAGEIMQPTLSLAYVDHMTLPRSDPAALIAAAGLFASRKVRISLAQVELLNDREHHEALDGEHGEAPAELSAEVEVRYAPYVDNLLGREVLVHEAKIAHRSPTLFSQAQGSSLAPDLTLFEGPVFDAMGELQLDLELLEVDWYPRFEVREWMLDHHQRLVEYSGAVPLVEGSLQAESEYARIEIRVELFSLY